MNIILCGGYAQKQEHLFVGVRHKNAAVYWGQGMSWGVYGVGDMSGESHVIRSWCQEWQCDIAGTSHMIVMGVTLQQFATLHVATDGNKSRFK